MQDFFADFFHSTYSLKKPPKGLPDFPIPKGKIWRKVLVWVLAISLFCSKKKAPFQSRKGALWWSRRESNSYLLFRKQLFYPLNYGTDGGKSTFSRGDPQTPDGQKRKTRPMNYQKFHQRPYFRSLKPQHVYNI